MKSAKNSDFESNQEQTKTHVTKTFGGTAPSEKDVIKSVNARSKMRHDTGGDKYADVNVLPQSGGEVLDRAGVKDNGYLVKKGIPYGVEVFFNTLPPGMDITDQEVADIREEPMKVYSGGISYPGDGWG